MITGWLQWARSHPRGFDVVLAVVTWALATLMSALPYERGGDFRQPLLAVTVVAAASSLALLWRRSHPRAVVLATVACSCTMGAMATPLNFTPTPPIVGAMLTAIYTLTMLTDRRTTTVYAIASAALLTVSVTLTSGQILRPEQIGLMGFVLLPAAIADSARNRRDYVAAVEARAELAERTREEEARRRVGEERLRIARDLHDVVAHHIALAHVQAGTAGYLFHTKPRQAQEVLDHLADSTSSALRELRATVGLLRENGNSQAPLQPAPGLARLSDLLSSFEQAGLTVSVSIQGEQRPLSPGVDLTAYRILQEALTNVTKHAGTSSAAVRLTYGGRMLTLTVTDDGREPPPSAPPGYGLIGMRERAKSVGGRLLAGRRAHGGFEVTTELPLEIRDDYPGTAG
ncbi:sensor histidine kinase [Streptomyces sp. NPDC048438]|uniref:sensor histidine kinase n=1 Tax=Streptomyces sp. NPDC048438 TaxID=3365551 RepID=UPI0037231EB8